MRAIISVLLLVAAGSAVSSPGAGEVTGNALLPETKLLGKQVFDRWCMHCHAPESGIASGPRFPGTASLAVKYGGQLPAALEERSDMTPEFLRHFVRQGVLTMPPFRKTEISDAELQALVAYLSRTPAK